MLEATLAASLAAFLGACAWGLRRVQSPLGYWLAGWVSGALAGVLLLIEPRTRVAELASLPFASFLPWMLLAGALALRRLRPPVALFAAALLVGAVRLLLAAFYGDAAAHALELALEPPLVLAAAWHAARARPAQGAVWSERVLAPLFVVVAAAGAVHLSLLMRSPDLPPGLVAFWLGFGPLALGIQLHAASELGRRELRRAREELSLRVAERTEALERANRCLREEVERHRQTEERLRSSEERYRSVSELSSDFSFALRVHPRTGLHLEWVTGAFERLTGYPPSVLEGWDWLRLLAPDDRDGVRARVSGARGNGRSQTIEQSLRTADGATRTVRIEVVSMRGGDDGSVRVMGAARDVSEARRSERERQHLERRMEDAQRLESLGMLTGGIAHDFNNLLAVVLGNVRILADQLRDDARATHRLERVRAAAEHAARLTEQMLTYSGRASVSLETCDVSALVREMQDLLRASIAEGCELDVSGLAARAVVRGDPTRLRQVVLNLVTNASEALEGGQGVVAVATRPLEVGEGTFEGCVDGEAPAPGPYVALEVRDDGCGMDEATRRRIFEPFFTTRFSGRGLGLASVLGIVRAHGGGVRVESAPGRGTKVCVLLPAGEGAAAGPEPPVASSRGRGRILVIDDDPDVLEVACEFLERAGYEAVVAQGGLEGVEVFRKHAGEIDGVVLDLAMPDLGGERVYATLREVRDDVPVVLVTGYSAELAGERFGPCSRAVVLRKPFEPEQLCEALERARLRRD